MTVVLLLLLIAAVVLGIIGWVVKGLLWLFVIGLLLFMAGLVFWGVVLGRGHGMRSHR